MTLVIDTGVLVASARPAEPEHADCRRLLETSFERRLVPAPVLVEVEYFLRGDPAWDALLDDVIAGGLEIDDLTAGDYERIREVSRQYRDLRVGFVDAAVFAVVERLQEDKLATLDHRHFAALRPAHTSSLRLLPD